MKHHQYNPHFTFVKDPVNFDKYTDRALLQYCLGATMYMPGTKDFVQKIVDRSYPGLTSMVMCFEDACPEQDVPAAELNSIHLLDELDRLVKEGALEYKDIPLIFFRVRNLEQFQHFSSMLKPGHVKFITGINFPKFNSVTAEGYMCHLVLNIRVGGTDFSSCFGVRRGINYTIYDILTVSNCLMDILNVFTRDNDYTVSGPVWEYFKANKSMKAMAELPKVDLQQTLLKRKAIVNDAVDGLMRELVLDQANGFMGKTCIHPSHLNYINGMLAVTKDEYDDACQIINTSGGVVKGTKGMNEVGPHKAWAERILRRSEVYGVINSEADYFILFGE